jgi:tetratricopeptide (TPR) repeat protein
VRWNHWSDTASLVPDFPVFGTGAGTYALVNPPFQEHAAFGHFANADNLAFEALVELGGLGLLACLAAAAGFVGIVLRLVRTYGTPEARKVGLVGLWVSTSIGTNSATDFGLLLPANALLAALLAGCVLAFVPVGERLPRDADRSSDWRACRFRLAEWAAVVALLPWGPVALDEMATYRKCDLALTAVRQLQMPFDADAVSPCRERLLRILAQRPDDARVMKALAELHILSFRNEVTGELARSGAFSAVDPYELWRLTALGRLAQLLQSTESGAAASVLRSAVSEPKPQQLLVDADRLLSAAIRRSPFLPDANLAIAQVNALRYGSPTAVAAELRRAVALQPAEFHVLQQAALLAAALNDRVLLRTCLRQVVVVFSGDDGRRNFARTLASAAFPNDCRWQIDTFREYPEELVLLADMTSDGCRNLLLEAASGVLQHRIAKNPDDADAYACFAKLHKSRGSPQQQVQHLRTALSLKPREVGWRLELAEALIEQGRHDEALDELHVAERLCETDRDAVMAQIRMLRRRCTNGAPAPQGKGAVRW